MFNKTPRDLVRTLDMMRDRSIEECRYNETAAIKQTAQWLKNDRRYDGYDADALAKEAFDAKNHGRQMNLDRPYRPHSGRGGAFTGDV
jgi:hypothetical protein